MRDHDVYFVDHSAMPTGHDFQLLNLDCGGRAVLVREGAGAETWSAVLTAWDASTSMVHARASHGLRTVTLSPGMSSADACLPKE